MPPAAEVEAILREPGETAARQGVLQLKQLPVRVIESDEPLGLAAARIKAGHRLSVADAWITATAEWLGATLVHKDPGFEPLGKLVRLGALPLKASRG